MKLTQRLNFVSSIKCFLLTEKWKLYPYQHSHFEQKGKFKFALKLAVRSLAVTQSCVTQASVPCISLQCLCYSMQTVSIEMVSSALPHLIYMQQVGECNVSVTLSVLTTVGGTPAHTHSPLSRNVC